MILKPSKKKIFRRGIRVPLFIIGFLVFEYGFLPDFENKLASVIILISIGALPTTILLIDHLLKTIKIREVRFSETEFEVVYKNGNIDTYPYNSLGVIKLFKAAGMDKGNYSFNSDEQFYFANIITLDGKNIILTSLLGPDLSDALEMIKGVPVERKRTRYAFIFLNS